MWLAPEVHKIASCRSYVCTSAHTLSLLPSLSLSLGISSLLFSTRGEHFPYGNILGQHPCSQHYLVLHKKIIFPKRPRDCPREDLGWPNLTFSHGFLWFPFVFWLSSAITQCLSPTPTSTISFCSRSVLTNTFSVQGGSAGCYLGSGLPDLGLCVFSSIDRSGTLLVKPRVTSVHCSTVCENPK